MYCTSLSTAMGPTCNGQQRQGPMCKLHVPAQPTMLERYATKVMQLNTKYGNRKYPETWYKDKQACYQNHATPDIRQWVLPHNKHNHFVVTHVCQIMYENQIHNTKTSINNVLTTAHCA